jgi:anti-sigma factor RsiW
MPACVDQEQLLGGLADGELDAANTALIEAHVARCEECREELERLQAVRSLVAGKGVRHEAPEALTKRIAALPELSARRVDRHWLPGWLAPGVVGALAASLALLLVIPAGSQAQLDDELVAGHVRSLQVAHLTDVATSNEHLVRPWFNGKIDFAPPVPELSGYGFPLAGGRLDYVHGRTVPALVYHRRLHTINLFVWPAPATADRQVQKEGYSLDEWSRGGLRYAAVSDIRPAELEQFRAAFVRSSG